MDSRRESRSKSERIVVEDLQSRKQGTGSPEGGWGFEERASSGFKWRAQAVEKRASPREIGVWMGSLFSIYYNCTSRLVSSFYH
jgi:hypothetical protein